VPEKYIYGKALLRYWPLSSAQLISHDPEYNVVPSSPGYRTAPQDGAETEEEQ
jgi:hypothetical protein